MDNNCNNAILQICRTCMKEITDASFFYLDCLPAANTQLTIRQKLHSCIPELDLNIVSSNAMICSKCADNLFSLYEFRKNCLESEIQINKYIQEVQYTTDINLVKVVQFQQSHFKNLGIEVKMEDLEITEDFKNEDLVCARVFNETSRESTEPKYLLERQKVEMEDVLFNTFDDYNINCDLSAAEEYSDTHNSNIAQDCSLEVSTHQDNSSKNKCEHKAESKLNLILHLKHHTRQNFHHREVIYKRLSKYHKNLFCYYRCCLCNYFTKYKCLFDFHNRIHLTKNYKHIFKHADVHTIKSNKTHIKGNKRKCVKNGNNYSLKNQNKCKESKQHFSHGNSIKPNMRANKVEKPFKCLICEYQSSFKGHLKRHNMQLHTGEKPFSCSICEHRCSEKSNLKQHMRIHTGEKPFSCSVCHYQCRQNGDLKKHMRIHTGEKPFSCSVCEYKFNIKSDLKRHILSHTGEKPFSCSVCEYHCSRKTSLKRHILIHTGEKPFSCSVCKYRCSEKSKLKRHILTHTGEKPFSSARKVS